MKTIQFENFNTINRLTVPDEMAEVLGPAQRLCAENEKRFNRFRPDSDIGRLNGACGQWVSVDAQTVALLLAAERMRDLSGGAFNVLSGSIAAMWYHDGMGRIPEEEALLSAVRLVQNSHIETGSGCARIIGGAAADFGGIAKGYIADQLAMLFAESGVTNALIDLGGNVMALGRQENGEPWGVGIRDPKAGRNQVLAVIPAVDRSVVTSGLYERGFWQNGRRRHHIIDPNTGNPVDNHVLSVTVSAKSSLEADALSTALFVLGPERCDSLLDAFSDAAVLFVLDDGKLLSTPGLELCQPADSDK